MSADSEPDDQFLDTAKATALLAFADAGPNEPVSLKAIAALSIEAHAREERTASGVPYIYWDDTGESMRYTKPEPLPLGMRWRRNLQLTSGTLCSRRRTTCEEE